MENCQVHPERRSQPRYEVDADATLMVVNHGASIPGRIFEISLDGCRVRTARSYPQSDPVGVEVIFRINGIAFRLGGSMQWVDSQQTAGIHFAPMAPRRRDAVVELLAELEAERAAKEAKEAAERAALGSSSDEQPAPEESAADILVERAKPDTAKPLAVPPLRPLAPKPLVAITPPSEHSKLLPAKGPHISELAAPVVAALPAPKLTPVNPLGPATNGRVPSPSFRRATAAPAASADPPRPPEPKPPEPKPARSTGRERRTEARHSVDTRATVLFIDVRAQISGRILDLSMSGCRIRTDERFPVGIYRRVETEFNLDGLPFRLGGVVQSLHDKFTVGIRFLDVSPRKRDQLAQLMEEIEEMRQKPSAQPEWQETNPASETGA